MVEETTGDCPHSETESSGHLLDRRSYLQLTGAATTALAGLVATGSVSAQEEYDVIELDRNEAITYDLDHGETFENKLIDQTAAGATFAIRARDIDDFTIRNIGFYGIGDRSNGAAANQHMLLSGNGTVENVYISNFLTPDDEQSSNTPMGGIYVRPSHSGHIDIRRTYIEGMGNNASYADRPGRGGGQGTVTYDNCVHQNNTVSQFRIGTSGTVVRNSIGIVDDPNGERATYIGGSNSRTARGIWAWHNDNLTVEDSTFYVNPNDPEASNTFHARMHNESSGSQCVLNVTNCYVNGDAPNLTAEGPGNATINLNGITEEPTATVLNNGVPTSAEMAASGAREYVDPFDEGLNGEAPPDDDSDSDGDEDDSQSISTLRVDGEGSSKRSAYRFTIDGTVEKSDELSEYGNNASVSDQIVEGFVRGGIDGFQVDGALVEIDIDDGPIVYADGEAIDPEKYGSGDENEDDGGGTAEVATSIASTTAPVEAGERLDVTATVSNSGDAAASETATLVVGGETVDTASVSVPAGESTSVTLGYATYPVRTDVTFPVTVAVGDASASTSVSVTATSNDDDSGTAEVTTSIASTTAPVEAGERLDVTATVSNSGDAAASETATLVVGGETVDTASVSVPAGESTSVTLGYATYPVRTDVTFPVTVAVGDASASTSVSVTADE